MHGVIGLQRKHLFFLASNEWVLFESAEAFENFGKLAFNHLVRVLSGFRDSGLDNRVLNLRA